MLELILVRHGESEGNRDRTFTGHGPSPLTELGRRQAAAVGVALRDPPPTAVYVSDLPRAMQTAEPLCRSVEITPVLTAEIRERDMGAFVGMRFDEVQSKHADGWTALVQRDSDYTPPGGESHNACAERVGRFLDGLRERHDRGRIVVVSHGVAIHHMVRHLVGRSDRSVVFVVDNCSMQRVELHDNGGVRVVALNDTRHLAGL